MISHIMFKTEDEKLNFIEALNIYENHIENCLKYNFIKLSCNWHVKSSSI
jgi:hypothetical protein